MDSTSASTQTYMDMEAIDMYCFALFQVSGTSIEEQPLPYLIDPSIEQKPEEEHSVRLFSLPPQGDLRANMELIQELFVLAYRHETNSPRSAADRTFHHSVFIVHDTNYRAENEVIVAHIDWDCVLLCSEEEFRSKGKLANITETYVELREALVTAQKLAAWHDRG